METLYQIPDAFTAGTTVIYRRSYSDFPVADGWTLTLYLKGASSHEEVAGTSGTEFVVTLSAAETALLVAGTYKWTERASKAGEIYDASSGTITILANPDAQAAGDAQTWEEKTLAVIEATLSGRLTSDMESYSIGGRAVSKMPLRDLIALRASLQAIVAQQRNADSAIKSALVYFTGTGLDQ